MSTRTRLRPQPVFTNASLASNLTSIPTVLQSLSKASYSVTWSGTSPVGTLVCQVSNDYALNPDGTVKNAGTWSSIPSTSAAISGNSGNGFIDVETGAYACRLSYTFTSGTGTLSATVNGKVT